MANGFAVACDLGILIYDTQTYDKPDLLRGYPGRAWTVAYSPEREMIASPSSHGKIRLIHESTGVHLRTLDGNADSVAGIVFSPDGKMLASYNYDGDIRLLDVDTNELQLTLKGHTGPVL